MRRRSSPTGTVRRRERAEDPGVATLIESYAPRRRRRVGRRPRADARLDGLRERAPDAALAAEIRARSSSRRRCCAGPAAPCCRDRAATRSAAGGSTRTCSPCASSAPGVKAERRLRAQLNGRFRAADIFLDEASVMATENAVMAAAIAKGRRGILNAASRAARAGALSRPERDGREDLGDRQQLLEIDGSRRAASGPAPRRSGPHRGRLVRRDRGDDGRRASRRATWRPIICE